jgi:hypothetical protein
MLDHLPTFFAFHFYPDGEKEAVLLLSDTQDKSLSWCGDIGDDDVVKSCKGAIEDIKASGIYATTTAYGSICSICQ